MKIAVLNYPGTVGKTTTAVNLFKPRMPGAEMIAVESINETAQDLGVDVKKITGERFREVFTRLLKTDNAIVDIGSSNIEDFLDGMAKFEDSHLEFDYFVLPVTSGTKEQKETIAMFKSLQNFGVDTKKVRVLFNRVNNSVEEEFEILIKYNRVDPGFEVKTEAAIMENDLFDILGQKRTSMQEILADDKDYRSLIRQLNPETDSKLLNQYADAYTTKSLAKSVQRNLDQVFESLFGGAV